MQRELTVSQLNRYIEGVFEDERVLHGIKVLGEVYELKRTAHGTFFTLREGDCTLSCVSFRSCDDIRTGMSVSALGAVEFYPKSGRVSFITEEILPVGEGALALQLAALKERLRNEGLFENRPPLPERVTKVAVITSEHGAVLHDILSVVKSKDPMLDICLYDVRVQGEESASAIAEAVRNVNADRLALGIDAIVIARGGGSAYDLRAYNAETVARAVAESVLPVVSAVGHETDYTLCDLCASVRAGTPSIAADVISSPVVNDIAYVRTLARRIGEMAADVYSATGHKIVYRAARIMGKCEVGLSRRASEITAIMREMLSGTETRLAERSEKLAALSARLDGVSPLAVLGRGYAKVTKADKTVVSVAQVTAGDRIRVTMKDGSVDADVV